MAGCLARSLPSSCALLSDANPDAPAFESTVAVCQSFNSPYLTGESSLTNTFRPVPHGAFFWGGKKLYENDLTPVSEERGTANPDRCRRTASLDHRELGSA